MKYRHSFFLTLSLTIAGCGGGGSSESGVDASQEPQEVVATITPVDVVIVQPIKVTPLPKIEPIPKIDPPSPVVPRPNIPEL